jgi:hypothetical protein
MNNPGCKTCETLGMKRSQKVYGIRSIKKCVFFSNWYDLKPYTLHRAP